MFGFSQVYRGLKCNFSLAVWRGMATLTLPPMRVRGGERRVSRDAVSANRVPAWPGVADYRRTMLPQVLSEGR